MLIVALFIIGLVSRLTPHLPNFTPIVAIALFSGAYLNKKYAIWLALGLYIITDLIIGLHETVLFTWSSIILITVIGASLKKKKITNILGYTLLSSILFFVVTNFGVWLWGWYPRTFQGLIQCYVAAIPFFRTSILANLVYAGALFGVHQFFFYRLKSKNLSYALLLS
jgi:hypothetical protein